MGAYPGWPSRCALFGPHPVITSIYVRRSLLVELLKSLSAKLPLVHHIVGKSVQRSGRDLDRVSGVSWLTGGQKQDFRKKESM